MDMMTGTKTTDIHAIGDFVLMLSPLYSEDDSSHCESWYEGCES